MASSFQEISVIPQCPLWRTSPATMHTFPHTVVMTRERAPSMYTAAVTQGDEPQQLPSCRNTALSQGMMSGKLPTSNHFPSE